MSKKVKRIASILIAMLLCFSAFVTVSALPDGEGGEGNTVVAPDPEYTDPPYVEPDPEYTDPPYVETEPEPTDPPYVEPEPTDPPYIEPEPVYTDPPYVEPEPDYNQSSQYEYFEKPGETYAEPDETEPTAQMYNSNTKVDDKTLSGNDWKDIAAKLKNASGTGDDSDSFDFIQKNDDLGDNGHLTLYGGIALLLLGLAGIGYVVASYVLRRKKIGVNKGGAHSVAHASSGETRANRSNDDYGDGYKTEYRRKKNYDTADVKLTKSSQTRKKGGTRYRK